MAKPLSKAELAQTHVRINNAEKSSDGGSKKTDLVCFSHLRWDFVFQRPQHLMSRMAKGRRTGRHARRLEILSCGRLRAIMIALTHRGGFRITWPSFKGLL